MGYLRSRTADATAAANGWRDDIAVRDPPLLPSEHSGRRLARLDCADLKQEVIARCYGVRQTAQAAWERKLKPL